MTPEFYYSKWNLIQFKWILLGIIYYQNLKNINFLCVCVCVCACVCVCVCVSYMVDHERTDARTCEGLC